MPGINRNTDSIAALGRLLSPGASASHKANTTSSPVRSFAQDLLRQYPPVETLSYNSPRNEMQGPPRPKYGKRAEKQVDFEYTYGYPARGRGCKRTLTWLIPLAQIKSWVRESEPGALTVWPYVSEEEQMIRRQTARVHHMAKENGWKIKTARLAKGLRIIYCGARVR